MRRLVLQVLLADDETQVRAALRLLLEQEAGLTVKGEAATVEELLSQTEMSPPDLILLDWELSRLTEVDVVAALRMRGGRVHVIALSGRPEARRAALSAGADAFVSKSDPAELLLAALDRYRHTGGEEQG